MKNITSAIAFISICGLVAAATNADSSPVAPATQPAPMVQLNAVTPAPTAPTLVAPPIVGDVYLIPFGSVGGDNSLDWAGRAVQQNMLTDLARNKIRPVLADKPIPVAADAQTAAKAAGAKYLVSGTYQVADQQVRFTGQIVDTASGNVVGGLSATGAPRDLFSLEDSLSTQVLTALSQLPGFAGGKIAPPAPAALQPQVVVQVIQPPAVGQVGQASSYQGSALQQYVDANRTPSVDFNQQVQDAQDRSVFGSYNNYGYFNNNFGPDYGNSFGYGGFGYGFGVISGPVGGFGRSFGGGHFSGHPFGHSFSR